MRRRAFCRWRWLPTREFAFGGTDLKTVYLGNLGNLAGDRIPAFRSPIAGAEPVQWCF